MLPRVNPLLVAMVVIGLFPCLAQQLGQPKAEAAFASDFELKFSDDGILVRRKGTQKWQRSIDVRELIEFGMPDGSYAYLVTKSIKPPKPKRVRDADFPPQARNQHREGIVVMHAVVDEYGKLRSVGVFRSSGGDFSAATMEALRTWLFEPASLNGQPVPVLINITMRFRLE